MVQRSEYSVPNLRTQVPGPDGFIISQVIRLLGLRSSVRVFRALSKCPQISGIRFQVPGPSYLGII